MGLIALGIALVGLVGAVGSFPAEPQAGPGFGTAVLSILFAVGAAFAFVRTLKAKVNSEKNYITRLAEFSRPYQEHIRQLQMQMAKERSLIYS